jgi:Protein of unknown function (DUF3761)
MKNINLIGLLAVSMTAFALALPVRAADSAAPTTCADGTTSTATGKGACSSHGGVQKAPKTAAAPAAAPAAAAASKSTAGNTDPTGATAKCKDGTYSKSQHRAGTCSSHGGVAEWLTAH